MIKIGIIGGGNMGSAIIRGIRKKYKIVVCETDIAKAGQLRREFKVAVKDLPDLLGQSDIIILAVKPQNIDDVLTEMAGKVRPSQMVISIAAGITSTYIEKKLGGKVKLIRTMPNLPLQIGVGITAISKGKLAKDADVRQASQIFNCVGDTVEVKENQMNAVTAVSGSGPAYVFAFVETWMAAAQSLGIEKNLAKRLVLKTMSGSIELLKDQKADAAILRKRVTSKGGTTEAALKVLSSAKIEKAFKEALKAAKTRAQELSKE
jgi:pyrroline-5-carboxylate reductase